MEDLKQNKIPSNVCFLTAGVDVQKDRLELEIVGWTADKQSYSIDYRVIDGNTTLSKTWNELSKVVDEVFIREDNMEISIARMAVDSGYNTSEVYAFCRKYSTSKVIAIKGRDDLGIPVAPPRQVDYNKKGQKIGKLKVWNIGVSLLKSELYSWLLIEPNTDGTFPEKYCHFPQYQDTYFKGLASEQYLPKIRKWKKTYERNEPLDCRIYARACANLVGLDRLTTDQLNKMGNITKNKEPQKKKTRNRESSFWD